MPKVKVQWQRDPVLEQRAYELGMNIEEVTTTSLKDLRQVIELSTPADDVRSVATLEVFNPKEVQDSKMLKELMETIPEEEEVITENTSEEKDPSEEFLKPADVLYYIKLPDGLKKLREKMNGILKWSESRGDNVRHMSELIQRNLDVLKKEEVELYRKRKLNVTQEREKGLEWLAATLKQLEKVLEKRRDLVKDAELLGESCHTIRRENKQIEMMLIAFGNAVDALKSS